LLIIFCPVTVTFLEKAGFVERATIKKTKRAELSKKLEGGVRNDLINRRCYVPGALCTLSTRFAAYFSEIFYFYYCNRLNPHLPQKE